jgi:CRISPR-associated protein Cmr4
MTESSGGNFSVWLSLLAETSLHPGSGRELGVVDLPVAREGGTGHPLLYGSQLKGSLRDRAEQLGWKESRKGDLDRVFGSQEAAGRILFSDARVVLLPVRSLTSAYRWVTCPHILERLARDLDRSGAAASLEVPEVQDSTGALSNEPEKGKRLFLEEREVTVEGSIPEDVLQAVRDLFGSSPAAARLERQLTVVSDDTFSWFARYGLPVRARNVLDDHKRSINLWYEESLPPDTLLLAVVSGRSADPRTDLAALFEGRRYLQVGGNETVGEGWVAVHWTPKEGG